MWFISFHQLPLRGNDKSVYQAHHRFRLLSISFPEKARKKDLVTAWNLFLRYFLVLFNLEFPDVCVGEEWKYS